jgi:uncharacterized protein with HEPN domain
MKTSDTIEKLKSQVTSDKFIKGAFYVGGTIVVLFLLGKAFKGLASTIRGFQDLKSAINGN